jgi:plasmid stabilization system protein ParE
MPQLILSAAAVRDLQRLRDFLRPKSPEAARRAADAIRRAFGMIVAQPRIGRMVEDLPEALREWPVAFGDSGYVIRYHVAADHVMVLAVRHQREAGF